VTTSGIRSHSPLPSAPATPRPIPQYSARWLVGVWASAALPMAALAWLVAPRLAASIPGPAPLGQALLICLTAGMIWQFVLVLLLVRREQGTLSWAVIRDALWLHSPRSPRTGRVGGRLWLVVLPLAAAFYAEQFVPLLPHPTARDLGSLLATDAGAQLLHGNWALLALAVTMFAFNTVLGEELLFRGFLLPRMNGAFGDLDWLANGLLFAAYHLHIWWKIPAALLDALILAYPTKRYRSAWIGIVVHSTQTAFLTVLLLRLVL
jgi:membrane protease YdiL (CAAX protease family)